MPIALKRGPSGYAVQDFQVGDALLVDSVERLDSATGNLVVGSLLVATEELQLGSATALTRSMGDAQIDGQLLVLDNQNDDSFLLDLEQTGTNPGQARVFVGNRDPEGNVVANTGDLYFRDGASATIYVKRGTDSNSADWRDLSTLGATALVFDWVWSTDTTATDPGSGNVKGDNATQASITNLYIDDVTAGGKDLSVLLADLKANDFVVLTEEADTSRFIIFELNGPAVDNTGWFTLPGTVVQNGSALRNNRVQAVQLIFASDSGSGGTPGGADTNVQFNEAGAFGGDPAFTWDTGTQLLTVNGVTLNADGDIGDVETLTFDEEHDNGSQAGAWTLNWNNGQKQEVTLTGSGAVTVTDPDGPGTFTIRFIQDATGGRVPTFPAKVNWRPGSGTPAFSTSPNAIDVAVMYFDGTNYWATLAVEDEDVLVIGPGSSTNNAIARWDGATGEVLQDSAVTIADDGSVTINGTGVTGHLLNLVQDTVSGEFIEAVNSAAVAIFHVRSDGANNAHIRAFAATGVAFAELLDTEINFNPVAGPVRIGALTGATDANLYITDAGGDAVELLDLNQTGAQPGRVRVFVGDRDPSGVVSAEPGSQYWREDGVNSTEYINTGAVTGTTWTDLATGGGGTPGGADTNVQFNEGGAFGGDPAFLWDTATQLFTVNGMTVDSGGNVVIVGDAASTAFALTVQNTTASGEIIALQNDLGQNLFELRQGAGPGGEPFWFMLNAAGTNVMTFTPTAVVDSFINLGQPLGIGTTSPGAGLVLDVVGDVDFTGDVEIDGVLTVLDNYIELDDIAAPGAGGVATGRLYKLAADDGLWWHPNGGIAVDLTVSAAGGDLQAAYDAGAGIAIAAGTPVALTATAVVSDALTIDLVGAGTGEALQITAAAAWAGFGIDIDYDVTAGGGYALRIDTDAGVTGGGILVDANSTAAGAKGIEVLMDAANDGEGITVQHGASSGTGSMMSIENSTAAMLVINADGSIVIGGNSGASVQVTAEGVGDLNLATLGTGDVVINPNGGGDLLLQEGGATRIGISSAGVITATPDTGQDFDILGRLDLNDENLVKAATITFNPVGTDTSTSGVLNIDFSENQKRNHVLDENVTSVTFTTPVGPGNWMVRIEQAAGLFSLPATVASWPSNAEFVGDVAPVAPTADNNAILLGVFYDGTTFYVQTSGVFNN